MDKVVIIGGSGTVGQRIVNGLTDKFQVTVIDQKGTENKNATFIKADATNYQELLSKVPEDTDCIINLLKTETDASIEEIDTFNQMTDVFFKATYYILMVANQLNIPKVIFASSNHVTDHYEKDGFSLLDRQIDVTDYPYMKGLYGVLKLASEQLGFIFSNNKKLSVVNIRIGSVPPGLKKEDLEKNDRLKRTLLSDADVVQLFESAIKSNVDFGTYYGVSDNPDKPWNMDNAKKELGFVSIENSTDYL